MLRNCRGGCGMIDQVSVIMSQRLRKGMWKDKVVNLFLTVYAFFLFCLLGQRKGGDVSGRKDVFGQILYASACV